MDAQSILTIMKMTQPLATLAHAEAMAEYGRSRGLTPFAEFYPIFSEKKEKRGRTWEVVGLKGLTFKEHYAVQNRWSQKSGGYSTPYINTERDVQYPTGYNDDNGNPKYDTGVVVRVGIITNRDYAALAQMALARIPGWDYKEEREAFTHYGEGFVSNTHRPPSGWTVEAVARKRATEQALKLAFGKEPTQAANIYAVSMDEQRPRLELEGAGNLLYPERKARPALAVVDAEPVTLTVEEEVDDGPPVIVGGGEWSDEADAANIAELKAEADAGLPGTPATRSATLPDDCNAAMWEPFLKYALNYFAFSASMEVVNTLRKHVGAGDKGWNPWTSDGGKTLINGDAQEFWTVLAEHANKAQA